MIMIMITLLESRKKTEMLILTVLYNDEEVVKNQEVIKETEVEAKAEVEADIKQANVETDTKQENVEAITNIK